LERLDCDDWSLPGRCIGARLRRRGIELGMQARAARFGLGVTATGQSSQYARGDESNQDVNGPLPGFVLVNLGADHEFRARWSAFARIDDVFDRRYSTFAMLGQNVFTAPGETFDATGAGWRNEQFRSVGVPRGAWLGISYRTAGGSGRDFR